jgi:hypothetical protein
MRSRIVEQWQMRAGSLLCQQRRFAITPKSFPLPARPNQLIAPVSQRYVQSNRHATVVAWFAMQFRACPQ